jgi:hypothetical protein
MAEKRRKSQEEEVGSQEGRMEVGREEAGRGSLPFGTGGLGGVLRAGQANLQLRAGAPTCRCKCVRTRAPLLSSCPGVPINRLPSQNAINLGGDRQMLGRLLRSGRSTSRPGAVGVFWDIGTPLSRAALVLLAIGRATCASLVLASSTRQLTRGLPMRCVHHQRTARRRDGSLRPSS